MENTVVIGAQWGDEGKAKITDLLAEKADLIIRYQGGSGSCRENWCCGAWGAWPAVGNRRTCS